MIEYIIYRDKFDIKFIRELWEHFFINDTNWYFNFYDDFIRLKVSKRYHKLEEHFLHKGWKWEQSPYNSTTETLPVMKRNFNIFNSILHGYTMLVMKEKDHSDIESRVTHLYFNMRQMDYIEEATTLSRQAISRARLDGIYEGIKRSK